MRNWAQAAARRIGLAGSAPIQALARPSNLNSIDFNGDDPNGPHNILWDLQGYLKKKGGIPAPSEEVDVAVLGGGLGGLTTAWQLKDYKTVVLEQAKQFGGNAKGERYGDSTFTMGAVYISEPEPGTAKYKLLQELGLLAKGRVESSEESTVFYNNRFCRGFWDSATDPDSKQHFEDVFRELNSWITDERKIATLSFKSGKITQEALRLDNMTFEDWLKEKFGTVHPRLMEYFQLYGWSSMLGSVDELSALQMLDFLTAETGKIMTFPGGLAAISQKLFENLSTSLPEGNLRPGCLAVDVRKVGDKVQVCYNDPQNELRTLTAKAVVFCGPKFVAKKVIQDAPEAQKRAWEHLEFRAYVVGNVILDSPIRCPSFELYCLEGEVPDTPLGMRPSKRNFSDICFATWADHDRTENGVITVFSGLPYPGANQNLFAPGAHEKHKQRMLGGIDNLLKALGKTRGNVLGIRLTRWGHPLPVAHKGMLADGTLEKVRQPIGNSIFFANQDNWANPCFETSFREARSAAEKIRSRLG
jgi:hypothetical protein